MTSLLVSALNSFLFFYGEQVLSDFTVVDEETISGCLVKEVGNKEGGFRGSIICDEFKGKAATKPPSFTMMMPVLKVEGETLHFLVETHRHS